MCSGEASVVFSTYASILVIGFQILKQVGDSKS